MRINYFFLYSSVAIGLVCGGFSTDAHALKINPYPNKGEVTAAKQDVTKVSPQKAEAKKKLVIKKFVNTAEPQKTPIISGKALVKETPAQTPEFLPVPTASVSKVDVPSKLPGKVFDKTAKKVMPAPVKVAPPPPLEVSVSSKPLEKPMAKTKPLVIKRNVQPVSYNQQQPFSQKEKDALKAEIREEIKRELEAELSARATAQKDPVPLSRSPELSSAEPVTIKRSMSPMQRLVRSFSGSKTKSAVKEPVVVSTKTQNEKTDLTLTQAAHAHKAIAPAAGTQQFNKNTLQNRGLVAIQVQTSSASAARTAPNASAQPVKKDGWAVVQGQDLRDALDQWSRQAGVNMIWTMPQGYAVPRTSSINGTYEEAVQTLLEQYSLNADRPMGSLHVDPQTGKRTLVIQGQG